LLQNALDHAFPPSLTLDDGGAQVAVVIRRDDQMLTVTVEDDGAGLPHGFELDTSTGLGLSIVRTLVTTELGGEIGISRGSGRGDRPGTVVTLRVPLRPSATVNRE
jgi:two-component sensor histidine kinase